MELTFHAYLYILMLWKPEGVINMKTDINQYRNTNREDNKCLQEIANDPQKLKYWKEIAATWKESLIFRKKPVEHKF